MIAAMTRTLIRGVSEVTSQVARKMIDNGGKRDDVLPSILGLIL